ncbi:hypothetical protein WT39_29255 [Burkholderia territorii]|nr:hypothetical protein WT39_29255 [Burkholderia territorii]
MCMLKPSLTVAMFACGRSYFEGLDATNKTAALGPGWLLHPNIGDLGGNFSIKVDGMPAVVRIRRTLSISRGSEGLVKGGLMLTTSP